MKRDKKGILIIVPTFSPNTGGVETHMDDFLKVLDNAGYNVYVHTYSPITTPSVIWKSKETYGNVQIRRYRWFGKSLLHRIEKKPLLDFLYITPYLLLRVFLFLLLKHNEIDILHAHGLNAAFIGSCLKKIFKKKLIVSMHAIYEISPNSKTTEFIRRILLKADSILTLSEASYKELLSFGIEKDKLSIYRYWLDLDTFRPLEHKENLRKELNLPNNFTVLFVGRLTEIKGIRELVKAAYDIPQINFIFIGNGPLEDYLRQKGGNVIFLGRINNKELYRYYNIADIFCIPSQYKEGYGRVAMESLACGVPVVGSNAGGLSELLNDSVSILVESKAEQLKEAITKLYHDRDLYNRLKSQCRSYAESKFSESNSEIIIDSYEDRLKIHE